MCAGWLRSNNKQPCPEKQTGPSPGSNSVDVQLKAQNTFKLLDIENRNSDKQAKQNTHIIDKSKFVHGMFYSRFSEFYIEKGLW